MLKNTITRSEAEGLVREYLKSPHLLLHVRQTEAIMRKLASLKNADVDLWGITGLLHDLDLEILDGDNQHHGKKTVEILREKAYEIPEMFAAIIAHAERVSDGKRVTDFDFILAAAENLTGIISAYVAGLPDKKVKGVQVNSIKKRLKQLRFAASVNREFIADIEKTGISQDVLIQVGIEALTEIADEIGM